MIPKLSLFKKDDTVLLRSTKEMGRVEREPVLEMGEYWYRVRFNKRFENIPEEDLEQVNDIEETLEAITSRGSWGRFQAFRTALTIERIANTDQNTIYAFRAQRILFEAYQYKPLLKMLESPDRRLLIADEVGLGKTIEAGLILTELEARRHLERVLVVCPSRLRVKWRDELSRKFGQEFDIITRGDLEEYLDRLSRNPRWSRLAIISMPSIRNPELRERLMTEIESIDLVIVDEAHHARNMSSQTSGMLRDICELADAVLLLTATPLHLGNMDLFALLQALRPNEYRDYHVFDQLLKWHRGVHEASLLVRSQISDNFDKAKDILKRVFQINTPLDDQNPLAIAVIKSMEEQLPKEGKAWVDLERRIQDLHPITSILTRTRKRDVQEIAAVRTPKVFRCRWTPAEEEAYQKVTQGADKNGWANQPLSLGQIQRARQAASCLPAALESNYVTVLNDDDAGEITDINPTEMESTTLAHNRLCEQHDIKKFIHDSKLEELLKLLSFVDQEEPEAKVLIFTYFVGTSRYLEDRLNAKGYTTLRIAGDILSDPKRPERDERGKIIRRFRDDVNVRVLVSTEVGSEGLDFQFCHYLVNYDLPWNPMVVEQRIGRIDRHGQKSEKVHILNIVVEGTVEDRILHRLYDRIGIFKESIGQLEAILGEEMTTLQRDYVCGKLTPQEAEKRVEEVSRAIHERRVYVEELERKAGTLFGHEEYLKDQLRRVSHLGRYISEKAMLAVIETYLQVQHPTVRIWEEPNGVFHMNLSDELRREIQNASGRENTWSGPLKNLLSFCFDGEKAYNNQEVDLINVSHPLVKAAVVVVCKQFENIHARAARAVLTLPKQKDVEICEGMYYITVYAHNIDGIRKRREVETIAWSESQGILASDAAERLLHLALENGGEWDPEQSSGPMPYNVWTKIESEGRARSRTLRNKEELENKALYVYRKKMIEAERDHDLSVKKERLKTALERDRKRILPALEAQINKAENLFRTRLSELELMGNATCTLSDPIAVCQILVKREHI